MPYLLLNEIEQATKSFDKNNKSLYLQLHMQAFPLNEVDLNCPRCVEKMFSRLVNFKNKEMAKKKETENISENTPLKLKSEYTNVIVGIIGYGKVDTTKVTDEELKSIYKLGFKFLFDVISE